MINGRLKLALVHLQRNPAEAATILERAPPVAVARLLAGVPAATIAALFAHLSPIQASVYLERLDCALRDLVLEACHPPRAAVVLRAVPEPSRRFILESLSGPVREGIERVLRFPPASAGALADPGVRVLHDDVPIEQAISRLRMDPVPIASVLVVISRQGRVLGTVSAAQLLGADGTQMIGSLELARARTVTQGVRLSSLIQDGCHPAGPVAVVDPSGVLVGVLNEEIVWGLKKSRSPRRVADLAGTMGEVYWSGMGRLLAEVVSAARATEPNRDANRVEPQCRH